MTSVVGWALIGISAALLVRANLITISIGTAKVPLGPGLFYGTLRSLIEVPLKQQLWALKDAELDGRRKWILDQVDAKAASLTMDQVMEKARSYVTSVQTASKVSELSYALEKEIRAAKRNGSETEQIKQLITYLSTKGYTAPVYRLIGKPDRSTVRQWRSYANGS